MCAHDASKGVAVGDANGGKPQRLGLVDQLARVRTALEEAEVGADVAGWDELWLQSNQRADSGQCAVSGQGG
jgi:hypothetical protein